MTSPTEKKKVRLHLIFMLSTHIQFQDPISNRSWPYATDGRTHERTARPHTLAQNNIGGIENQYKCELGNVFGTVP